MSVFHLTWERYTGKPCPTCKAPIGERCKLMSGREVGREAKFPHTKRLEAAR